MSDREFKWQKFSAWLLEMDGANGFRGEFFSVDKCLGAGIKGREQGFREENALGIRVFNVMALDDIIIFHHWLLARGPVCHLVLAGFGKPTPWRRQFVPRKRRQKTTLRRRDRS